ncbi:MAG: cytidine deaminase [Gemmatimonadota bacterium]
MPDSGPRESLLERAREVRESAHAPYSRYRVGAALEASDGAVYVGCNVENASFPVTICAERVALGAAVAAGARSFRRVAISVSGERPASPCGMCRQALSEFGIDLEIVSEGMDGRRETWTLRELLPAHFELEGDA